MIDRQPQTVFIVVRTSWKAVADAVGHCILVFAFTPALLALPGWLRFEFGNAPNLHEPLILLFAPIRGFLLLLDAFQSGAASRAAVGCLQGLLLSAWRWTHEDAPAPRRRFALGASTGALAASLVATIRALALVIDGASPLSPGQFLFEITSGLICGLLATPAALRLLAPAVEKGTTDAAPIILP